MLNNSAAYYMYLDKDVGNWRVASPGFPWLAEYAGR